jgi:hypothetical protein
VKRNALDWASGFLKREGSSNRIIADQTGLYRVQWSGASHSDIVNLSRAVEAALGSTEPTT